MLVQRLSRCAWPTENGHGANVHDRLHRLPRPAADEQACVGGDPDALRRRPPHLRRRSSPTLSSQFANVIRRNACVESRAYRSVIASWEGALPGASCHSLLTCPLRGGSQQINARNAAARRKCHASSAERNCTASGFRVQPVATAGRPVGRFPSQVRTRPCDAPRLALPQLVQTLLHGASPARATACSLPVVADARRPLWRAAA